MAVYAEERGAPTLVEAVPAADPAPLGLAAFALTTFILSGHNATFIPDVIWVGLAMFYGGLDAVARRHVGVPEPQRLRRDGVLDVRRLLALARRCSSSSPRRRSLGGRPEGARRPQLARLVPARVRDLQHVHARCGALASASPSSPCSRRSRRRRSSSRSASSTRPTAAAPTSRTSAAGSASSPPPCAWYASAAGVDQRDVARANGAARWLSALGRNPRRITSGFTDAQAEGGSGWPLRPRTTRSTRCSSRSGGTRRPRSSPRRRTRSPTSTTGTATSSGSAEARERVTWFEPFETVCEWNLPYAKWFVGGKLNVDVQLRRPARRGRQRRQGRVPLGGRARGRPARRHVRRPPARDDEARERAEVARREEGHAGRHLHGHGPRGADRDARLRPHRRAAHVRLRRLLRRLALRPAAGHGVRGR